MSASRDYGDRVKESTTTTGTGDITLAGAAPGPWQTFNTAFGTAGQRFPYAIVQQGTSSTEWETGFGYLSSSTVLVRETVRESSNSDALVNFSAGTKDVFSTLIAWTAARLNTHGQVTARAGRQCLP